MIEFHKGIETPSSVNFKVSFGPTSEEDPHQLIKPVSFLEQARSVGLGLIAPVYNRLGKHDSSPDGVQKINLHQALEINLGGGKLFEASFFAFDTNGNSMLLLRNYGAPDRLRERPYAEWPDPRFFTTVHGDDLCMIRFTPEDYMIPFGIRLQTAPVTATPTASGV